MSERVCKTGACRKEQFDIKSKEKHRKKASERNETKSKKIIILRKHFRDSRVRRGFVAESKRTHKKTKTNKRLGTHFINAHTHPFNSIQFNLKATTTRKKYPILNNFSRWCANDSEFEKIQKIEKENRRSHSKADQIV